MEYKTDFYVTLSSDTPHDNNTNNKFKVNLCRELILRDFKVALCEIIFSPLFVNVSKGSNKIRFGYHLFNKFVNVYTPKYFYVEIPEGNYTSVNELVEKVNDCVMRKNFSWFPSDKKFLDHERKKVRITKDFKEHLVKLSVEDSIKSDGLKHIEMIWFNKDLAKLLGFQADVDEFYSEWVTSKVELITPSKDMCIYSNFVEHQIVSSGMEPLLRIIPLPTETERTRIEFSNRIYIAAKDSTLRTFEIECKDENGVFIPFGNAQNFIMVFHFIKSKI